MYRALSSRYGWTPETIRKLTISQIKMYLGGSINRSVDGRQIIQFRGPDAMHQFNQWRQTLAAR